MDAYYKEDHNILNPMSYCFYPIISIFLTYFCIAFPFVNIGNIGSIGLKYVVNLYYFYPNLPFSLFSSLKYAENCPFVLLFVDV